MIIKIRNSQGTTNTLRDVEILEIDGKPFTARTEPNYDSRHVLIEQSLAALWDEWNQFKNSAQIIEEGGEQSCQTSDLCSADQQSAISQVSSPTCSTSQKSGLVESLLTPRTTRTRRAAGEGLSSLASSDSSPSEPLSPSPVTTTGKPPLPQPSPNVPSRGRSKTGTRPRVRSASKRG